MWGTRRFGNRFTRGCCSCRLFPTTRIRCWNDISSSSFFFFLNDPPPPEIYPLPLPAALPISLEGAVPGRAGVDRGGAASRGFVGGGDRGRRLQTHFALAPRAHGRRLTVRDHHRH